MNKLVVHPTSVSQWLELVREASAHLKLSFDENVESYLVFLLMRFATNPEIAKKIIATDFLESHHKVGKAQAQLRKEVGDNCLMFSGLFPGRARARRVRISYYINIGKSAYQSLIDDKNDKYNDLFAQLSDKFIGLTEVMHAMREVNNYEASLDLLEALELWSDTGSLKAKEQLLTTIKSSSGIITNDNLVSKNKH